MRLALPLLALLALAACDGSESGGADPFSPDLIDLRTLSQDPAALIGTWELVAYIPESGDLFTTLITGRRETWTFRRDGTVTTVFDGDQILERRYRVQGGNLQFDEGGYGEDFGTAGDVLVLDSTSVDGSQKRYRRR